jgi:hypothetical protein
MKELSLIVTASLAVSPWTRPARNIISVRTNAAEHVSHPEVCGDDCCCIPMRSADHDT